MQEITAFGQRFLFPQYKVCRAEDLMPCKLINSQAHQFTSSPAHYLKLLLFILQDRSRFFFVLAKM